MSDEELDKTIKEEMEKAKRNLDLSLQLIEKLRLAGEDVTKLLSDYNIAKQKYERYKKAFMKE